MKKIILYIGILATLISCDGVLDIQPTNMIPEEEVKNDFTLVDALVSDIYNKVRFQSGSDYAPDQALLGVVGGEINVFAGWQGPFVGAMQIIDESGAFDQMEYWPYTNIRSANELLQILANATFTPELVEQKKAEVRWLRAFMYFELVKRYGGVPLITEAQSIEQPIEELYVERNSEKEIYDFIAAEMDDVVDILPDSYESTDFGRISKWAAYALKSRAMLYAGSIAKYSTVQLDGLLGIPASEANSYYQKSYDAAMQIINNSPHVLYQEDVDPVTNYGNIFINDGNSEVILAEVYNYSLHKTHAWNFVSMPGGFAAGWGSNNWLYLESVEKYEYKDGTSGKLDWSNLDGQTKFSLESLILNKDPRFLATAFYPEAPWQGSKVYTHASTIGVIPPDSDWPAAAHSRNRQKTGFLVRKRINEAVVKPLNNEDETDWIVFRTGEMYLNAGEAAFETGDEPEARRLINIIRDRAEMPPKNTLTFEDICNERYVELFNEEHRYWDLRRWRKAVDELNGKGYHGVTWEYYIDENKYTLTLKDADFGQIRTFTQRDYYFPIGLDRRADNPNLVENPGY